MLTDAGTGASDPHGGAICGISTAKRLDLEAAERVRGALDLGRTAARAQSLKVLSDPTRLLIMQALGRREGLVTGRREGKVVFSSLTERGRELLVVAEAVAA